MLFDVTPKLLHDISKLTSNRLFPQMPAIRNHMFPRHINLAHCRRVGGKYQRVQQVCWRNAQQAGRMRVQHQRIGAGAVCQAPLFSACGASAAVQSGFKQVDRGGVDGDQAVVRSLSFGTANPGTRFQD